ncbi:MAG: hypothetical protein KGI54_07100 [Pseudomonadota bacterium]|nr:hypothetical protein [Pseudomonadota bacterium]
MGSTQSNNLAQSPDKVPISDKDTGRVNFIWNQWFTNVQIKLNTITAAIVALSKNATAGFLASDGVGGIYSRTLIEGTGITITNPTGAGGNPVISASGGGGGIATINTVTGNTYTLVLSDATAFVDATATSGGITVTVPTNASVAIPIKSIVYLGARFTNMTVTGATTGITIINNSSIITAANSEGYLIKVDTDAWYLSGNLNYLASGSDPYWTSVVSLIHGIGTNGSTTITDSKGITAWTTSGSAAISTSQSKFSTSSLYLPGSSYLSANTPASIDLGNSDFTIEGFYYFTTVSSYQVLYLSHFSNGNMSLRLQLNSGQLQLQYNQSSTAATTSTTVTANTWHFLAATRSGSNIYLFIDGVLSATGTLASITAGTVDAIELGQNIQNTSWFLYGYVNEYRVTKGVARYTSSFTPPTAPFPNA